MKILGVLGKKPKNFPTRFAMAGDRGNAYTTRPPKYTRGLLPRVMLPMDACEAYLMEGTDRVLRCFVFAIIATMALAAAGGRAVAAGSVDVKGQRSRLTVGEEPKNADQVLTVQKAMVADASKPNAPQKRDVVITGQIGGMPNLWPDQHPKFPWYEKQASLFLVDNKVAAQFAAHAKSHGGNHHNCAFCQALAAKNAHAIAVINFVDEKGDIIRVNPQELLGLKENQTITIRGKARLLGGSMLVIDADGIYSPRQ